MAPRTAKAKKNADIKVVENEAPKKGRGKGKIATEPELESPEINDDEVAPVIERKTKRGKKSDEDQTNGDNDEIAPAPKKGRKKILEEPVISESIDDNCAETVSVSLGDEKEAEDEITESNGSSESVNVKGRKRPTKKEIDKDIKTKETNKGKKNTNNTDSEKNIDEKPKGKGRGRKPPVKVDNDPEDKSDVDEEEIPEPPVTKGRKKIQQKPAPEAEKEKAPEKDDEKLEPEPKKKETKSRKNTGKKPQYKEESDERDEEEKEEQPVNKRKNAKKEDKGKGGNKEVMDIEENAGEPKTKAKRGQKKAVEKVMETEEVPDTGEPVSKRRRKGEEKGPGDIAKKQIKSATNYESIDFSNTSKNSQGKEWNFKISCWNVAGIRAWLTKGGLEYIKYEKPDILCLQEVKCSKDKLPEEIKNLPGYHAYWLCSEKDGYAGVGVYTTKLAMNVQYGLQNEELDSEGRIITAEYEQFYLICTYVPNSGRKLVSLPKRLKWNEEFRRYVKNLEKIKPVIICGDLNVAHNEIDLTNPKTNKRNAGFTDEERSGMTELLGDGFVDTYRHFHPDRTGAYTFWSNMFNSRAKNVGWRLDYFIISQRLVPALCDSVIREKVYGSDHCPLALCLHLSSADKPKE